MTYYPTLAEDVARAKEILAQGRAQLDTLETRFTPAVAAALQEVAGGTIYGKDVFVAYKLLESFVEAIEGVGVEVLTTALRARARSPRDPR